ncbi:hypothetical protein BDA96_10G044000 [Sorghum bicolor]|jgi:hypothetical protein|uniref:DUF1618 domain-containing protein n=2 Tax=Sorghum bicolor TaxID=4558 RepID=A0A921TZL4_SORBI|nr:uncharacterized protein LOC8071310 [Sorghum bicolor]EER87841.2 hypothetical protein SORBI_3010G037800 [Sorghum bicolor]KAG0512785.1 hypothetical protein BDA96_10G044000 [Sorghum bicolor]|eukprot:XP_021304710.1 uncharacterized protein LOC8071310 [Sorghum bicolor]
MAATFLSSPVPKKARLLPCSPDPKKAVLFPGWVLLDRVGRTHCYDDPDAAASAVGDDATAVAVHTTSGQSGYLSFTLRAPPLVSYLDLHWPYGMPESMFFHPPAYPFVLSADENHVLLRIGLRNQSREGPNIFVYTVGASSRPLLRRLPACTKMAQGLAGRNEFMLVDTNIGILCRSGHQDDNYVVADLIVSWKAPRGHQDDYFKPSQVIASLCVFSASEGEWTVKEMLAPQPHGQGEGEFPVLWECDRVLPFAGRFLCWIDYYSGILLCDLSNDKAPVLYYKPFPGKQYPDEDHLNRGWPEAFRSVSVSQGMMRFVDIDKEGGQTSGLTITVWNFEIAGNNLTWEMQNVINLSDLWAQQGYQFEHLPCRAPEFPAVAKNDPDVLCCILREHELFHPGKVWIITIDMKHAAFQSCFRYVGEQIVGCNEDLDMDSDCIGSLLPTDFSKFLNSPSGNYS